MPLPPRLPSLQKLGVGERRVVGANTSSWRYPGERLGEPPSTELAGESPVELTVSGKSNGSRLGGG